LEHSIVAANVFTNDSPSDLLIGSTVALTAKHNIIGDGSAAGLVETVDTIPDANGNLIGGPVHGVIDPLLDPLADNGGPTFTHALLPGSPAINAGDLNAQAGIDGFPEFDQRGLPFVRVSGGRIDMGAFESQPAPHGDFNFDGNVDAADYVLWRKVLTTNYPAGYNVWTTQFAQSTSGGSGASVQEAVTPTATLLAADNGAPNDVLQFASDSPKVKAFQLLGTATTTAHPQSSRSPATSRVAAPLALSRADRQLIDFLATRHAKHVSQTSDDSDAPSADPTTDDTDESTHALDTAFAAHGQM
jgi:hypothetical protein